MKRTIFILAILFIFLGAVTLMNLISPAPSEKSKAEISSGTEYRYQELNPSPLVYPPKNFSNFQNFCTDFIFHYDAFAAEFSSPAPLEKRIMHANPSLYKDAPGAHGGAGILRYMVIFDQTAFETNWLFIHRGELLPGGGIGEHNHRTMEEMFCIFDGTAQFTVNGRTSQLPGGSMVVCRKGNSHAIYNNTEKPVQWMNLAVATVKGKYDNIDFNDTRVGAALESPVPFAVGYLDDRLIQWVEKAHDGKGKLGFRRIYSHDSFLTNWGFIDHCVLPPGTSIGYHRHDTIEECYMVIKGKGRATMDGKTFDAQAGDFLLNRLHGEHGIYNNSQEDLVLINMCVSLEKGKFDATNLGDDLSTK